MLVDSTTDQRVVDVDLSGLSKWFGPSSASAKAVDDIDLKVFSGEFFTLLGPSGCGKTTTLRMIAGLEQPSAGRINIGDALVYSSDRKVNVPSHLRDVSMVFQNYALWPHMNVLDNVAYPLKVQGKGKATRSERAEEALRSVGLTGLGNRIPSQLSGGQQQRAAIARATIKNARVMLFDEPLSNLDARLRAQMRAELARLHRELGTTSVYVTHDQDEALTMSDRIAVINFGRILEIQPPEDLYLRPQTLFAAQFVGQSIVFHGVVERVRDDELKLSGGPVPIWSKFDPSRLRPKAGDAMSVLVRPESVVLSDSDERGGPDDPNCGTAVVERRVFAGRFTIYFIDFAGVHLRVEDARPPQFAAGDSIRVRFPIERCWAVTD